MAISRSWRSSSPPVSGPFRARLQDIEELNEVFSDAFTDRYRRDGMVGVRVPALNPLIWRYAIEDADDGALLWRDDRGVIAAFNMIHRSGREGWMGPLAVRRDCQGRGIGKQIVARGVQWLTEVGATVIGLETMPRTMDNIGFYSRLGFVPGPLTITMSVEATRSPVALEALTRLSPSSREQALRSAAELTARLTDHADYSREIRLTADLGLGDTYLLVEGETLVGFALAHIAPLVEGRTRDELRVLKLVVDDVAHFPLLVQGLADQARRAGASRVAFRLQGEYDEAYAELMRMNAHVRWTDLRMSLAGHAPRRPTTGVVFTNWEI